MHADNIRQSLRWYQHALTSDPANVELRQKLAGFLESLDYPRQAAQELELCAKLLAARGDLLKAISLSKEVLRLDPTRTGLLLFLTRTYALHPGRPGGVAQALASSPEPAAAAEFSATDPVQPILARDALDAAPTPQPLPPPERFQVPPANLPTAFLRSPTANESTSVPHRSDPESCDSIELSVLTLETDLAELAESARPSPPLASITQAPALVRVGLAQSSAVRVDPTRLPRHPLLSGLRPEAFYHLIGHLRPVSLATNSAVLAEQELPNEVMASALVLVVDGAIEPRRGTRSLAPALGSVQGGDTFGEFGVLTGQNDPLTWFATKASEVLLVPGAVLGEVWREDPSLYERLLMLHFLRVASLFFHTHPAFAGLIPADRQRLLQRFTLHSLAAGDILYELGREPDGLRLLLTGAVEVSHSDPATAETVPATVSLAANATLGGHRAPATVRCLQDGVAAFLPLSALVDFHFAPAAYQNPAFTSRPW